MQFEKLVPIYIQKHTNLLRIFCDRDSEILLVLIADTFSYHFKDIKESCSKKKLQFTNAKQQQTSVDLTFNSEAWFLKNRKTD